MKAKKKVKKKERIKCEGDNFQLWCEDAFVMLKLIPENSIDSIICDGRTIS